MRKQRWPAPLARRRSLALLLVCTACSPDAADGLQTDAESTRRIATQTHAPSPDYAGLLGQAPVFAEGHTLQAATPPPEDAKTIGDVWIARVKDRGALLGYGLAGTAPNSPVEMIDVALTETEFNKWVARNEWPVPTHIRWNFVPEMELPPVSEAAKGAIRIWPASTTRTGVQPQALFFGKVELRDGCFFVGFAGQPADKLA